MCLMVKAEPWSLGPGGSGVWYPDWWEDEEVTRDNEFRLFDVIAEVRLEK